MMLLEDIKDKSIPKKYNEKLCLVMFAHSIILARDVYKVIEDDLLEFADDFEKFKNYPWGYDCYKLGHLNPFLPSKSRSRITWMRFLIQGSLGGWLQRATQELRRLISLTLRMMQQVQPHVEALHDQPTTTDLGATSGGVDGGNFDVAGNHADAAAAPVMMMIIQDKLFEKINALVNDVEEMKSKKGVIPSKKVRMDEDMIEYIRGKRPYPHSKDWIKAKSILAVINVDIKYFLALEILLKEGMTKMRLSFRTTTANTKWNSSPQLIRMYTLSIKYQDCSSVASDGSSVASNGSSVASDGLSEKQVSIVLYDDDILKYENFFGLYETYLVSCTKVRETHSYSIRDGTYEWVADRYTIVEAVTNNNGLETPLPALKKLDTLSFSAIEQQRPGVEFDLLTVVVNCSAIQYTTDQSKHIREVIVIDQSKKPFLFTIWGDLANNKGAALLHHLHEYPVILARRIGVTEFRGGIFISPSSATLIFYFFLLYIELIKLLVFHVRNSKTSNKISVDNLNKSSVCAGYYTEKPGEAQRANVVVLHFKKLIIIISSLNLAPIEDQVLAIPTIPELLSTSVCAPKNKKNGSLLQLCHLEVNIIDTSDTITVMIPETLRERILSLTAEQIYEQVAIQLQKIDILHPAFTASESQQLTTTTFWWPLPASSHGLTCTKKFCLAIPGSQS
ncbi:hypothetical protein FXO37_18709 [Capsicum annuum]|nr:hypothetical protein FXO37_18709 [Capsicum annuum]